MPRFHIQWRVSFGRDEFTAHHDVDWGFVPAPGVQLDPFEGASPVEVESVHLRISGTEGDLVLRSFEPTRAEQFAFLRTQLSSQGWRLR
jgi:hypothetical protein